MKRSQILRWSGSVLSTRSRPSCLHTRRILLAPSRSQSTATATAAAEELHDDIAENENTSRGNSSIKTPDRQSFINLPSPPPESSRQSAKLNALHARLLLSPRLPLQTLARCLIDPSADPHPSFNNTSLSILGGDLLGYHTSEMILCRYPRLPMAVIFAAMNAYVGPAALASIAREWGIEAAASPGGEVDPGLLQFRRQRPAKASLDNTSLDNTDEVVRDANGKIIKKPWRRGIASLTTSQSYLGDWQDRSPIDYAERPELLIEDIRSRFKDGITLETASWSFVRALLGAVYLHTGRAAAKAFFNANFASRHLDVSKSFSFRQPTRDLSRLCAREGFASPVARILSETGRASRTPVFVVGVFSGREKLGEASGASLDEARFRAAIAALKGWYLYSPVEVRVPSDVEGGGKEWSPVLVDGGEVIV